MAKQKPTLNTSDIVLLQKTFATKKDLEPFSTKSDLKPFAKKQDLKSFATKIDLKNFATKQDLRDFATKDDLRRFATKQDLRSFATKQDLVRQRKEIIDAITEYLAKNYVTKAEFSELKEHISRLPTRDEFFKKMDEIVGDYKTFLQERDAIQHQLEQLKRQITIV